MAEMSLREAYGRALADYAAENPEVVCLDVDTSASTLTHFFAKRFPERFVNVGIAEPCMVNVGVGLALGGYIPFVNAFAALVALRAAEQIRTCVCYARTNVKIASSYAGLSDFKDGPTHHSIVDIAFMRALPDMTVIVPADAVEMAKWIPVIAEYDGRFTCASAGQPPCPYTHPMFESKSEKALHFALGMTSQLSQRAAWPGEPYLQPKSWRAKTSMPA
jgi:transketolase